MKLQRMMELCSGVSLSRLRAKLHRFLCDGLKLVVSSPVHVQIELDDTREDVG